MTRVTLRLPIVALTLMGANNPQLPIIAWHAPALRSNSASVCADGTPLVGRLAQGRVVQMLPARGVHWALTASSRSPMTCTYSLHLPLARPERLVRAHVPIVVQFTFNRHGWARGQIRASLPDDQGSGPVYATPGGVAMADELRLTVPARIVRAQRGVKLLITLTVEARTGAGGAFSSGTMEIEQIRVGAP